MKYILLALALSTANVFAVCTTPISRANIGSNSVLTATRYNADVNAAYVRANNLPGDCIVDASITTAKLAAGSVTAAKIEDGAITSAKLATGAIPEAGRLIRVSSFTSSGTWTRGTDVGSVMVQVVGGGGASFYSGSTDGGNSSFGGHCLANGGARPASGAYLSAGGAGGTASNGDINLTGGEGDTAPFSGFGYAGYGGMSVLGYFGMGGTGSSAAPSGGGGAGGYCAKVIARANLNATEAVTVGTGGTNGAGATTPGKAGIVLVYEYSL